MTRVTLTPEQMKQICKQREPYDILLETWYAIVGGQEAFREMSTIKVTEWSIPRAQNEKIGTHLLRCCSWWHRAEWAMEFVNKGPSSFEEEE